MAGRRDCGARARLGMLRLLLLELELLELAAPVLLATGAVIFGYTYSYTVLSKLTCSMVIR